MRSRLISNNVFSVEFSTERKYLFSSSRQLLPLADAIPLVSNEKKKLSKFLVLAEILLKGNQIVGLAITNEHLLRQAALKIILSNAKPAIFSQIFPKIEILVRLKNLECDTFTDLIRFNESVRYLIPVWRKGRERRKELT